LSSRTLIVALLAVASLESRGLAEEESGHPDKPLLEDRKESQAQPHYLRAALEMSLLIGGGTAWYWIDRERQVGDWDFPSWRERLSTDVIRFDNNPFRVNWSWHALSGAGFHYFARENNMSMEQALGFNIVTSLLWEYGLEYREKVSLNDLIFTSTAGLNLGEFSHWLGVYLDRPEVSPWLRYTFGLGRALHGHLDGVPVGESGLIEVHPSLIDAELEFAVGLGRASTDRNDPSGATQASPALGRLTFRGRLVALPGYLRSSDTPPSTRFFRGANVNSLRLDVLRGEESAHGMDVLLDTFVAGWHYRGIQSDRGLDAIYGLNMAYRYRNQHYGPWRDRIGLIHLPGPGADLHYRAGRNHWRLSLRGYGDFGGIEAMNNGDWNRAYPDRLGKAILRKQGYYYGWGLSTRLAASLSTQWGPSIGAELYMGRYSSHEGLDRVQEDLTDDVKLRDRVTRADTWLRWPIYRDYFLSAQLTYGKRTGTMAEFSAEQKLSSVILEVGKSLGERR
jgi:hypothetical protein